MGLEAASFIHQLDANNPVSSDSKGQGDDHLRLIKFCVQNTLPNVDGQVTASHTELNFLTGVNRNLTFLNPLTAFAIGSYVPTLTNVGNAPSLTNVWHRYVRFNDFVQVMGRLQCSPAAGQVTIGVSLPVASNFSAADQSGGGGGAIGATISAVFVSTEFSVNDRLLLNFISGGPATTFVSYMATYLII
jgi:hypothetical protein